MTTEAGTCNVVRTRVYRDARLHKENFPLDDVSDYLDDENTFLWIDLCREGIDQLNQVAAELGLHELAIEDAIESRQRPKLDRYADHQFLSMYGVVLERATGQLRLRELACFITTRALVTVRKDDAFDIDELTARWDSSSDLAKYGVAFLLHGLIDQVVDEHFAAVQALDEELEDLEDLLFESSPLRPMCSDGVSRCARAS